MHGTVCFEPVLDYPKSCTFAERLQQMVAKARKDTLAAQHKHKRDYDAKHVQRVFVVNDQRLLFTSGLNLQIAGTNKLAPRFVGPFKVLERIGEVAYKLELPPTMQIHNVFHVSLLKQYHSDGRTPPPPPAEVIDDEPEWEVKRILDHRLISVDARLSLSTLSVSLAMDLSTLCGRMMWRTANSLLRTTGPVSLSLSGL